MENELNMLHILISICIVFGSLWITSPKFRYCFKVVLYTVCLIIAGTIGTCLSLPNGRTPKNHWSILVGQVLVDEKVIGYMKIPIFYCISKAMFLQVIIEMFKKTNTALTHVWPENCVVLLKSSLKFVPGFNVCAYLCEAIFINRFSKVAAHKSVEQAINAIRNYRKIWIFPEGTRNSSGTMLPFKKGAFIIAREANVPIVPVVISSYHSFYRKADYKFDYGGRVIIEILPAIDPSTFSDIESISEECHKQMENVYRKISYELCPII